MQCPECLKEFKNYNSYRVHKYRFHNPYTKYRTHSQPSLNPDPTLALPAAAVAGLAVASTGGWKKWLILILVLLAIAGIAWYLLTIQTEEENRVGT